MSKLRKEERDPTKKVPTHRMIGIMPPLWTDAEYKRLMEGVERFGKDYESITNHVRTKDR